MLYARHSSPTNSVYNDIGELIHQWRCSANRRWLVARFSSCCCFGCLFLVIRGQERLVEVLLENWLEPTVASTIVRFHLDLAVGNTAKLGSFFYWSHGGHLTFAELSTYLNCKLDLCITDSNKQKQVKVHIIMRKLAKSSETLWSLPGHLIEDLPIHLSKSLDVFSPQMQGWRTNLQLIQ